MEPLKLPCYLPSWTAAANTIDAIQPQPNHHEEQLVLQESSSPLLLQFKYSYLLEITLLPLQNALPFSLASDHLQ